MGQRYERDSVKSIDGPLIFFSDSSSKEGYAQEVIRAQNSGLCFFSYKKPGEKMISFGSSAGYLKGIVSSGFVIGLFNPSLPYITIPYGGVKNSDSIEYRYSMPRVSTTKKEYEKELEGILESLKNNRDSKIVASRVEIRQNEIDITECFFDLCNKFPYSYIFCFSTPVTGCWIGASPELLLQGVDGKIKTMALAGTRQIGERIWDEKNIKEQEIVEHYIKEIFKKQGYVPKSGETYTKKTGKLEHICTPIEASEIGKTETDIENLLKNLSPTPALCGYPKDLALREIERLEKFDRGCYGGFCGNFHSMADFTLNVVLRCASIEDGKYCIYAGGGITSMSEPEKEWRETELKIANTFG